MNAEAGWERFIEEHFPGYLLPDSAAQALSEDAAARFLERISGRPDQLTLLRGVSTLAPRVPELRAFALRDLPDLVRRLPSRTETKRREWEGGFQGRLDVRGTLAYHLAGQSTRFVTRARHRRFDLPENVLVRCISARLLELLARLRHAGLLGTSGWGAELQECEGAIRHATLATVLREVPEEPLTSFHEQAAREGRIPCYARALEWHRALVDGLDSRDERTIARVVAEGALGPLAPPTRFELAVLVRLLQALWDHLQRSQPARWRLRRTLVAAHRRQVASLQRDDGAQVDVYYNQAHLEPGPSDRGAHHYLAQRGRMRPDITVVIRLPSGETRAVVIEVKLSSDPAYLLEGYHEAQLYRAEYAPALTGWPKAILVASGAVPGAPRREDDVVAVSWDRWVPPEVTAGILAGL
ncbi:MAG: hypothetical protein WKG00_27860 [Polyangiaceae bacterium]